MSNTIEVFDEVAGVWVKLVDNALWNIGTRFKVGNQDNYPYRIDRIDNDTVYIMYGDNERPYTINEVNKHFNNGDWIAEKR